LEKELKKVPVKKETKVQKPKKKKGKQEVSEADMEEAEHAMAKKEIKEPAMPHANTAEETDADAKNVASQISAETEETS
jgi:hypothetical protein